MKGVTGECRLYFYNKQPPNLGSLKQPRFIMTPGVHPVSVGALLHIFRVLRLGCGLQEKPPSRVMAVHGGSAKRECGKARTSSQTFCVEVTRTTSMSILTSEQISWPRPTSGGQGRATLLCSSSVYRSNFSTQVCATKASTHGPPWSLRKENAGAQELLTSVVSQGCDFKWNDI